MLCLGLSHVPGQKNAGPKRMAACILRWPGLQIQILELLPTLQVLPAVDLSQRLGFEELGDFQMPDHGLRSVISAPLSAPRKVDLKDAPAPNLSQELALMNLKMQVAAPQKRVA